LSELSDTSTKSKTNTKPKRMRWYEAEVSCIMGITGYEEEDAKEALIEHLKLFARNAKIHKFYLKQENGWAPENNKDNDL
jgi:hypothetical protein